MTIYEKLAQVHAVMRQPVKDSKNPHFNSNFASLNECKRVVDDAVNEAGDCFYYQKSAYNKDAEGYELQTIFVADNQELLLSSFPFTNDSNPQKAASASTYARRYSMMCAFNLAAEDDDGNKAAERPRDNPELKAAKRRLRDEIQNWCARHGDDSPDNVKRKMEGVTKRPDWERFNDNIGYIEQIISEFKND